MLIISFFCDVKSTNTGEAFENVRVADSWMNGNDQQIFTWLRPPKAREIYAIGDELMLWRRRQRSCFVRASRLQSFANFRNVSMQLTTAPSRKLASVRNAQLRMDGETFFSPSSLLVKIFSVNTHLFILYHSIELKARKMVIDKENLGFWWSIFCTESEFIVSDEWRSEKLDKNWRKAFPPFSVLKFLSFHFVSQQFLVFSSKRHFKRPVLRNKKVQLVVEWQKFISWIISSDKPENIFLILRKYS